MRKEQDYMKSKLVILEDKIDKINKEKIIKNISKNNTFNTQNINISAFGKEDMSYLSDEVCKQIMSKGDKCLLHFIEEKHFNKKNPENTNIYMKNWKDQLVFMFDGTDWQMKHADPQIVDMLKISTEFLIGKYKDLRKILDDKTKKAFFIFLKKINFEYGCNDVDDLDLDGMTDISEFMKTLLKESRLLLYNKRKMGQDSKLIKLEN
jgi:hypothetical protein